VSSFSADWLALREPYDHRARSQVVFEAMLAALDPTSVRIVDIACGTGSTFRAVSPRLPARQNWRLVDSDLSLLARTPSSSPPRIIITTTPTDLNRDLEGALDGPLDLVTMSALLDLVSEQWLTRFTIEAAARRLPVYAALNYDGRIEFTPADVADQAVLAAVNRHQRRNKGFGPALGPAAAQAALERFRRVGYAVTHGASDWTFGPDDHEIQVTTLSGWAIAARETNELSVNDVIDWLDRRRDHVAAGRSSIRVGHLDLFARPMTTR
jgi:hypothetical protein